MSVSDSDNPDTLTPKVEIQPIGTPFTNVPNATGSNVGESGVPVIATVTVSGLTPGRATIGRPW